MGLCVRERERAGEYVVPSFILSTNTALASQHIRMTNILKEHTNDGGNIVQTAHSLNKYLLCTYYKPGCYIQCIQYIASIYTVWWEDNSMMLIMVLALMGFIIRHSFIRLVQSVMDKTVNGLWCKIQLCSSLSSLIYYLSKLPNLSKIRFPLLENRCNSLYHTDVVVIGRGDISAPPLQRLLHYGYSISTAYLWHTRVVVVVFLKQGMVVCRWSIQAIWGVQMTWAGLEEWEELRREAVYKGPESRYYPSTGR